MTDRRSKPFISRAQFAELLGMSPNTLHTWKSVGEIPDILIVKRGGHTHYVAEAAWYWIRHGKQAPETLMDAYRYCEGDPVPDVTPTNRARLVRS